MLLDKIFTYNVLELGFVHGTYLHHGLALRGDEQQGGDASHLEYCCQIAFLIHIDFINQ